MSYFELWTILGSWKSEFSSKDFASVFSSPDPRKVLFDMSKKGFLERIERGRYRVVDSGRYMRSRNNIDEAYDFLRTARLPYALTGVDAVFVWTKGGYNANRFSGSYPICMRIPKSKVSEWEKFIRGNGKKCIIEGKKPTETLYGVYYVVIPEDAIESRLVNGLSVEPLEKTVEFCRRESYTYEPALEMLDKEYDLGLRAGYETAGLLA